jgi:hypothetical protein
MQMVNRSTACQIRRQFMNDGIKPKGYYVKCGWTKKDMAERVSAVILKRLSIR